MLPRLKSSQPREWRQYSDARARHRDAIALFCFYALGRFPRLPEPEGVTPPQGERVGRRRSLEWFDHRLVLLRYLCDR